ncbi:hypothetical protein HDU85_007351 [Gaertneriomyces sp. JEL0708]|nr:hypothetical protein HDU85_007351 [Gaertneriomyces sp. JEL0708]
MSHRKVDVDQFDDEDAFVDENQTATDYTADSAQIQAAVTTRAAEVRSALSRSDVNGAIQRALEDPPAGRVTQNIKDQNADTVMEAIAAARSTDIPNILKGLNPQQLDTLIKYIYRGMASPEQYNSAVLLAWHEKATEIGGLGSIVRVLTDRRTV